MKKPIVFTVLIILTIAVGVIWYASKSKQNNELPYQKKEIVESDVKKVAAFATIRVIAELYFEKYGKYPKAEGNTPETRWQSFSTAVVNEKLFPYELPQDPRQKETGFSYDYQTDLDQQNAIFKATLEAPDDTNVKMAVESNNDVDGIVYGIDCNKPNYCILAKHRQ